MARRKYERLDKAQSLGVQPSSDNLPAMFLAELTKGFCVNDLSLNSTSPRRFGTSRVPDQSIFALLLHEHAKPEPDYVS